MATTQTISVCGGAVAVRCARGDAGWVRRVYRAADDGGVIQAPDMLALSTDPRMHSTQTIRSVLASRGASIVDD